MPVYAIFILETLSHKMKYDSFNVYALGLVPLAKDHLLIWTCVFFSK